MPKTRRLLAGVVLLLGALSGAARAQPPQWANDSYAGLDGRAVLAGVGEADFAPEMNISSAVAYARSVKSMAESIADIISMADKTYGENRGQKANAVVKDLAEAPLGASLTKLYAGKNSDIVEVAISVNRSEDEDVRFYAQECADPATKTLHVRTAMSRATADYLALSKRLAAAQAKGPAPEAAPRRLQELKAAMARGNAALERQLGEGYTVWKGANLRLDFREIRVGRHSEYSMLVMDKDTGLSWIEHWPTGGANLMRNGEVAASYVFDKSSEQWTLASGSR